MSDRRQKVTREPVQSAWPRIAPPRASSMEGLQTTKLASGPSTRWILHPTRLPLITVLADVLG